MLGRLIEPRALRRLRRIEIQITRIADALERAYPPPAGTPAQPARIDVEDVNPRLQAQLEMVTATLLARLGRDPSPEDVLQEYEQVKHLL